MSRSRRIKEAIKTGLAMALVYGIAMRLAWMNPYWAAFAIAFISLPTQGQSLNKGVQRMGGTLVGCVMALFFLGLFPQDRWSFVAVISLYCGVATYLMTGRKFNYFWFCAGFVCVVVAVTGSSSPSSAFDHAVARTLETGLGIVVWTLISVFLWPQTNSGTLDKVSATLAQTQTQLFRALRDHLLGTGEGGDLPALMKAQVAQLGQLDAARKAAGAESYKVYEVRRLWAQLDELGNAFMTAMARWRESLPEVEHIDVAKVMPGVEEYFTEVDRRLEQIQGMLGGVRPQFTPSPITIDVNKTEFQGLKHFDRAAVAVTRSALQRIDAVTRSTFACVGDLKGFAGKAADGAGEAGPVARSGSGWLPVLDPDRLRGCVMVIVAVWTGFLVWVYVNPPGHASYLLLPTIPAFIVAQNPWIRMSSLVRALVFAFPMGMLVYVFIMPRLSSYVELGPVIFTFTFVACYFFPGLGRAAGLLALINMVPIQNEQTYSFAAVANSYLFVLMGFGLAIPISYITFTSRPEKAFMHLLSRFFRSSEFVMSRMALDKHEANTILERWRRVFHQRELRTLPRRLATWGRVINHDLFPANSPAQVESIVTEVQGITYRLEELVEVRDAPQAELLVRELLDDVRAWRVVVQEAFRVAAKEPDIGPQGVLRERLTSRLAKLEKRVRDVIDRAGEGELTSENYEHFYGLLGGYRGVSQAGLSYAGVAATVNWEQWRETRL